jgi:transketolase
VDTITLQDKAKELRREIIKMITAAGSGHPGGSLSAADILTVLYFDKMNIKPKEPKWEGRDYFVLSKGHAAPALYGALALRGYFPVEQLATLRKLHSPLQGHPVSTKVPGVDVSTGSLGQGVSVAAGIAKGLKIDGKPNHVYALLGDGECQEGEVWEALMFAAHYKLDNLTVIIDRNRLQIDGPVAEVMSTEPLDKKLDAFGFNVLLVNGHDIEAIGKVLDRARAEKGRPTAIIANTIKGRGVSFMENQVGWHGNAPKPEEAEAALQELR